MQTNDPQKLALGSTLSKIEALDMPVNIKAKRTIVPMAGTAATVVASMLAGMAGAHGYLTQARNEYPVEIMHRNALQAADDQCVIAYAAPVNFGIRNQRLAHVGNITGLQPKGAQVEMVLETAPLTTAANRSPAAITVSLSSAEAFAINEAVHNCLDRAGKTAAAEPPRASLTSRMKP